MNLNIVRGEILNFLLVRNLQASDGVVAKLYWRDQNIPSDGVQLLIKLEVLPTLLFSLLSGTILDVNGLSSIENR